MKRLISILICFAIVMTFAPAMHIAASGGVTYYVSPEGSDSSSGLSESEAWKTFSYAAKTAQAGDTVIFEDGTYNESQLTIITNSGTEFLPIVFKSKNKHGAIINYTDENSANNAKLQINGGKEYIEIRDFTFTQEEPSTDNTGDIMIRVRNSAHCKIAGNKISEIYEEGIKLSNAYDVIAEDNIITKAGHEGIDAVNAADCIIRNNKIIDCGRTGVMIKGNSRNCQIYNNIVKNTEVQMNGGGHAFTIGGQTGIIPQTTLGDWSAETGFEAYNCVFYNNIVYASEEKILNGFSFMGAKNCHAYNNTIYGVKNAFNFETTQGIANDWEWDVPNRKPVIKNNIVMNTSVAYKLTDIPENMESDYNLFNNAGLNVPTEENSVYDEDPLFTDAANGDFSIPSASPAAKAGVPLPLEVEGFEGFPEIEGITENKKISLAHIDFDGKTRKTPWDIGAYNNYKIKTAELLYEDFETGTVGNDINGWNEWSNTSTSLPNGTLDTFYKIFQDGENKVGQLTRTNCNSDTSKGYNSEKQITKKSGDFVSVKFRVRSDNVNSRSVTVNLYNGTSKFAITQYFSDSRLFFGNHNVYVNSNSAALATGVWYNYEVLFDMKSGIATLYLNGVKKFDQKTHNLTGVTKMQVESNRTVGATVPGGHDGTSVIADVKIDDISIYSIGAMEPVLVEPTKDGALNKAEITFSNEIDATTLATEDIVVNEGAVEVSSVEVGSNKRKCIVTFASELELETQYDITIGEVSDTYGLADSTSEVTSLVYKTRDRKFDVSDIKFYKDFGEPSQQELESLTDGKISATLSIVNEKTKEYKAVLIIAHKRGGKIVSLKAEDASVSAETFSSASREVQLTISSVSAEDSVEAYLWNSLQGMKPIGDAKIITQEGVSPIASGDEGAFSSLLLNASISNATADSGLMELSGNVTPSKKGIVTAYVLKPGFKLGDIDFTNFSSAVDFVGQKASNEDGSYSFNYTIEGAVNNTVYNAYAGGESILIPKEDSVTFFGSDYIEKVVAAVNAATATQITQMLSGTISVPNVAPGVMLNTVLGLNLEDYNTLNNYGDYEKYKNYVAVAMEKEVFSNVEDIRAKFPNMVLKQKNAQKKYLSLLNEINNSLWSNLAQKFQENDTEAQRLLHLNWSGSYASIKHDADLLEKLYKKLETIPFKNFNDLRYSFENEAKALIPTIIPPVSEPEYSGGGGGGGGSGVKYTPDLAKDETLEPIAPQETVEEAISFDDLDSVPWAKESIVYLAQNNIINGVEKKKFAPDSPVTREQFVKMVVLAMKLYNEQATTNQFMDVEQRGWYNSYIASALERGIVHGVDNEHFGVGQKITRAEMAAILFRAARSAGKTLKDAQEFQYTDNADIPDYASEAIARLGAHGIMNGIGNGLFAPREQATRAMAAKVIYLLMGVN